MKTIYRLVTPEKLELYDLKRNGILYFRSSVDVSNFNLRKIRYLILSAYFINWDMTRIENAAYKPQDNVNLFASKSIFKEENLIKTAPLQNKSTGFWAQAWMPKDKSLVFLKGLSKKTKISTETLTIRAIDNMASWRSGPVILNNSNENGFVDRHLSESFTGSFVENLDKFKFTPRALFMLVPRRKPYLLLLAVFVFLVSLLFAWQNSIRELTKLNKAPVVIIDNNITGIDLLSQIQTSIPDGAIEKIGFDQRKQEVFFTFSSKSNADDFFKLVSDVAGTLADWNVSRDENIIIFMKKGNK